MKAAFLGLLFMFVGSAAQSAGWVCAANYGPKYEYNSIGTYVFRTQQSARNNLNRRCKDAGVKCYNSVCVRKSNREMEADDERRLEEASRRAEENKRRDREDRLDRLCRNNPRLCE